MYSLLAVLVLVLVFSMLFCCFTFIIQFWTLTYALKDIQFVPCKICPALAEMMFSFLRLQICLKNENKSLWLWLVLMAYTDTQSEKVRLFL